MPSNKEIVDYYAFSKFDYRLYNGSFDDIAMHYGMWDQTTRTHHEALENENRVVARIGGIGSNDQVIDLGCGYGSTSVWLASHIGCSVTGITLSSDQVIGAQNLARNRRVKNLVTFVPGDFHRTPFQDSRFDVAIAIESFSHSSHKLRVLKEAWRILRPGGRLVVADGYFGKPKSMLSPHEREIARSCFEGVHVPPLPERVEFGRWLTSTGFSDVVWHDKTQSILPTAARVNRLGTLLLPISRVLSALGVRALQASHMKAFINQYAAFRDGLGIYGVFCARKPTNVIARDPRCSSVVWNGVR